MRLFYRNDRFEIASHPAEKNRIKAVGGWAWAKKDRVWWTKSIGTAAAFRRHAVGEAAELLDGIGPCGRITNDELAACLHCHCFAAIGAGLRKDGPTPCGMVAWKRGARFTFDGAVVVPREDRDRSILEAAERDVYRWLGFERLEDYAAGLSALGPAVFERATY